MKVLIQLYISICISNLFKQEMLAKKDTYSLMVGEDLITHPHAENLAKLCGIIDRFTEFNVVIIPTQTNTLGVAQICELSKEENGFVVGGLFVLLLFMLFGRFSLKIFSKEG